MTERPIRDNPLAVQILSIWGLLASTDTLIWRGTGTGVIHAAFTVAHDPASTLLMLALLPAAFCVLWSTRPGPLVIRALKRYKPGLILILMLGVVFACWWAISDATMGFCRQAPYPEDIHDRSARLKLANLQSNYWSAAVANSPDDMLTGKQDYMLALTSARGAGCLTTEHFLERSSVRAKWLVILQAGGHVLLVLVLWILLAHASIGERVERLMLEGIAVAAAIMTVYPVLAYYSDWYISFGEVVVDRPYATIAGIAYGSLAMVVLAREGIACMPLWQRLAVGVAAAGLTVNLMCVLWPEAFVHIAEHLARMSLAVVIFLELMLAGVIAAIANRFIVSIGRPTVAPGSGRLSK